MNYELLDFGDDRKLERFGDWVLDRPAPGVETAKSHPSLWHGATASYTGDRTTQGHWRSELPQWAEASTSLSVMLSPAMRFEMLLSPLPSGQVGIFPEQWSNWQWIAEQAAKSQAMRVLNLFAYTGGSTLAAALAGAQVTHVDAARSMVQRARENAQRSGLADASIRWVVEDAVKFCQREVKRGNRYDAIIIDPPTYGHGPQGEKWSIKRDLMPLLKLCQELTTGELSFALMTCHTPAMSAMELGECLTDGLDVHRAQTRCGRLLLKTSAGRELASGDFARWSARSVGGPLLRG